MKNSIFMLALIVSIPFFMESCDRKTHIPDPVTDCGCPDETYVCNGTVCGGCPEGTMRSSYDNSCNTIPTGSYFGVLEGIDCLDTISVHITPEGNWKGINISSDDLGHLTNDIMDYYYQGVYGDTLYTPMLAMQCNVDGTICDASVGGRYSVDKSTLKLWFRFFKKNPYTPNVILKTCTTTLALH